MKKKIAALALALMMVSAVPAFAAGSGDNGDSSYQNRGGYGYCYGHRGNGYRGGGCCCCWYDGEDSARN